MAGGCFVQRMATTRLFVALVPPLTVRTELAALAVKRMTGVHWTPVENFHLTMRFIGETSPEKLERYAEALDRVRVEPFILPVEGVGVFPNHGPAKVLWAGVGNAHTRLFQLRKQVDEALLAVDGGLDVRHFHPHFTLGRLVENHEPKELEAFLVRQKNFEAPPFWVSEFQLLASESGAPGNNARVYRTVQAFALQPRQ